MEDRGATLILLIIFLVYIFVILPIPARIARSKGYSFWGFIVFALFFWPIALIVSLLIGNKMEYKSESDKAEALVKYKNYLMKVPLLKKNLTKRNLSIYKRILIWP